MWPAKCLAILVAFRSGRLPRAKPTFDSAFWKAFKANPSASPWFPPQDRRSKSLGRQMRLAVNKLRVYIQWSHSGGQFTKKR